MGATRRSSGPVERILLVPFVNGTPSSTLTPGAVRRTLLDSVIVVASLRSDRDRLLCLPAGVEDRLRDAQALIPIDFLDLRQGNIAG